jgi:lysine-N-methylase
VCGDCCKEYLVALTEEEHQRIVAQGWDVANDLGGLEPFVRKGPFWKRRNFLNHRPDGSCVFLGENRRCRIHERFGYETKPLACRLFPFVLIPVSDHWRVGMRYACPSAAANKGRAVGEHSDALNDFAAELAKREGLTAKPDGSLTRPPALQGRQRVDWADLLRLVDVLLEVLGNRRDPLELRLRKCLGLREELARAELEHIQGNRLSELLALLRATVDSETPANLMMVPSPRWVGRMLFRQAVALFTRKDHGPNRGLAGQGRLALLRAAWCFSRGRGPIPRMHKGLPETTFEDIETPRGPLPLEAERILERYYLTKVGSLQFCGPASFGLSLWDGFEMLALTYPMFLWVARMYHDLSRPDAIEKAMTIVDDHLGFNKVLATFRQRLSFYILARSGELTRLIAWYSR